MTDFLCNRFALRGQHFNLPQLRDNLFCLVSLFWAFSVLHQAQSHTSGETTFKRADQKQRVQLPRLDRVLRLVPGMEIVRAASAVRHSPAIAGSAADHGIRPERQRNFLKIES
jgi:hypothetical protein